MAQHTRNCGLPQFGLTLAVPHWRFIDLFAGLFEHVLGRCNPAEMQGAIFLSFKSWRLKCARLEYPTSDAITLMGRVVLISN